jgi:hypothetical protein
MLSDYEPGKWDTYTHQAALMLFRTRHEREVLYDAFAPQDIKDLLDQALQVYNEAVEEGLSPAGAEDTAAHFILSDMCSKVIEPQPVLAYKYADGKCGNSKETIQHEPNTKVKVAPVLYSGRVVLSYDGNTLEFNSFTVPELIIQLTNAMRFCN